MPSFLLDIENLNINHELQPTVYHWWEEYTIISAIKSIGNWIVDNNKPIFFVKYRTNNSFRTGEFLFDSFRSTLGTIPNVLKHMILDNHVRINQKFGYLLKTINGITSFFKKTEMINSKKFKILVNAVSVLTNVAIIYNNIPIYDYNNKNNIYNYTDFLLNEFGELLSMLSDLALITTIFYSECKKIQILLLASLISLKTAASFSLLGNVTSFNNLSAVIPLFLIDYLNVFNFIYDNYNFFEEKLKNLLLVNEQSLTSNKRLVKNEETILLHDYEGHRNYGTFPINKINEKDMITSNVNLDITSRLII